MTSISVIFDTDVRLTSDACTAALGLYQLGFGLIVHRLSSLSVLAMSASFGYPSTLPGYSAPDLPVPALTPTSAPATASMVGSNICVVYGSGGYEDGYCVNSLPTNNNHLPTLTVLRRSDLSSTTYTELSRTALMLDDRYGDMLTTIAAIRVWTSMLSPGLACS